ncbi:hypothetical protein [Hymenobacter artigasi]|nr:hypothetical protein [Hymenobacter artigasi]
MQTSPSTWLIESARHQKKSQRNGLIISGLLVAAAVLVQLFG